jgi:hypothetical protein
MNVNWSNKISVREVPRMKKIYNIIARPINTIKRSLIIPHIIYFLNIGIAVLNEIKYSLFFHLLSVLII